MKFFNLIPYYFTWHYTRAIGNILIVWGNYMWFALNYFSIKTLLISFFKPYRRITEKNFYKNKEESKTVTVVLTIVGVVLRLVVILVGLLTLVGMLILGLILFLIWFILPVILVSLVVFGVMALI